MQILGLAGWSGSGKTTLLRYLLPWLVGHGVMVSTIKHAHRQFDIDRPGKDSYHHRQAGACEVMVSSSARWALIHELRGEDEYTLDQLINQMTPVDLLIVEGFKNQSHAKIEVYREAIGKPLLYPSDPTIKAVITDDLPSSISLPVLSPAKIDGLGGFILAQWRLKGYGTVEA